MGVHNRLLGAVKRGMDGVQSAYRSHLRAAEARAKARVESAKTKLEREKARADLAREKLKLERELYEAKAAVKGERERVAAAKRKAGVVGIGERARRFIGEGEKAYRSLVGTPKKKRTKGKRRPQKRGGG